MGVILPQSQMIRQFAAPTWLQELSSAGVALWRFPDQEKEIMLSPEASSSTPFDDGELYDTLLGGFNYGLDFYVDLARRAMGPVLDLGCGTGRILLPCMRAGVDIDGLDLFEPMLAQLRQSAAKLGLTPRLYRADMSDFRTQRRYALIMIPFNAFTHNLTQDSQIQCLGCCREHLLPGSMLVFDGAFPGLQWISGPDGIRVLEGETTDPRSGHKLRVFDTRSFDRVQQLQHSITEVESIGPDGTIELVQRSEYDTRWVYKEEMALLLRHAGYARWEIGGDFDGRPLTQETDGMVVRAWSAS
jgi:SAM-dependent methyltransferase